jgi:hypothetical protein
VNPAKFIWFHPSIPITATLPFYVDILQFNLHFIRRSATTLSSLKSATGVKAFQLMFRFFIRWNICYTIIVCLHHCWHFAIRVPRPGPVPAQPLPRHCQWRQPASKPETTVTVI